MGSSGGPLTWARLPRTARKVRSRSERAIPCARCPATSPSISGPPTRWCTRRVGASSSTSPPSSPSTTRTREVLAIGDEAWQMIGRTPGYIVAVRPMRQGAITDFEVTERMLSVLLRRVGVGRLNRPKVLICVPSAITAVERRAVKEAARRAGASASYLIEQPMAAAIGAGLAIHEPVGSMVVDVGGGTSEMAVISLGGVVALRAIRCGGFDLDASIQAYVRHDHGVAIGERTAEAVKHGHRFGLPLRGRATGRDPWARGRDRAAQDRAALTREVRGALEENVATVDRRRPPTAWATRRRSWPRTSSSRASTSSAAARCCAA